MSDNQPDPYESTTTLSSQFSTSTATSTNPLLLDGNGKPKKEKKSLYRRYHDAKTGRNKTISDEELLKYTGKTKEQIVDWGKNAPGVAGNQLAGKLAMGGTTGLGGMAAGEGFGGWGTNAGREPKVGPDGKELKKMKKGENSTSSVAAGGGSEGQS
ncbi:hypothetical protein QBC37DRAFT_351297 [Rhypophila decipiens]|uniref:Uncharacterized protein n=1 Tax=Rhypophila decipiens TaxID=261697 RepID=A0AAN7B4A1_9PEZI|nr:hypothetical protein QBC37DRAFT_351297 [Rhypophila decipiens]